MEEEVIDASLDGSVDQEKNAMPIMHAQRKPVYSFFKRVYYRI